MNLVQDLKRIRIMMKIKLLLVFVLMFETVVFSQSDKQLDELFEKVKANYLDHQEVAFDMEFFVFKHLDGKYIESEHYDAYLYSNPQMNYFETTVITSLTVQGKTLFVDKENKKMYLTPVSNELQLGFRGEELQKTFDQFEKKEVKDLGKHYEIHLSELKNKLMSDYNEISYVIQKNTYKILSQEIYYPSKPSYDVTKGNTSYKIKIIYKELDVSKQDAPTLDTYILKDLSSNNYEVTSGYRSFTLINQLNK